MFFALFFSIESLACIHVLLLFQIVMLRTQNLKNTADEMMVFVETLQLLNLCCLQMERNGIDTNKTNNSSYHFFTILDPVLKY